MKKIYKNPELEVVKIQTMQMLAASNENMSIDPNPVDSGTPGDAHYDEFDW